jgi:hypothetical protein
VNVARAAVRPIAVRWPARLRLPRPSWPDPVRGLRWLRASMLAMIVACAALCGLVAYQGHRELTAADGPGAQVIADVNQAYRALVKANADALTNIRIGDASLIGPSRAFVTDMSAANGELALSTRDNVAGARGAMMIHFTEGLLSSYSAQIALASVDSGGSPMLGRADVSAASGTLKQAEQSLSGGGDLGLAAQSLYAHGGLRQAEQSAVRADLHSRWLGSRDVWPLLLAPFLVLLLLAAGTSRVLWQGFRRVLSVRLVIALALTLGLICVVTHLTAKDAARSRRTLHALLAHASHPPGTAPATTAYSLWPLEAGLILAVGAAVLAFAAYRPRLEEYRYRP